jgi:hypothetical protein
MFLRRQRVRFAAIFLGLPAVLACSLLSQFSATPTPLPAPTATLPPVIETFDGSEDALDTLNRAILDDPGGVAQMGIASLPAEDVQVRYAAVYALSLTADASQAEALLPALQDPDGRLRTIAAGALIGLGRKESIPILIAALSSDDAIPYSEPPTAQWQLAYRALNYYTGQDFGFQAAGEADAAGRAAAAQAWQAWWDQVGVQLHWEASTGRYVP